MTYTTKNMQKIVTKEQIENILVSYGIGKKPLSMLLGWGETTICRYLDGDTPSEKYSNILLNLLNNPNDYLALLDSNKNNITKIAYTKSRNKTLDLINDTKSEYEEDKPISSLVRVGASTINIVVADVDKNVESIKAEIDKAFQKDVDLLVFNELTITGYTCQDLFLQGTLINDAENAIIDLAAYTRYKKMCVVVGAPIRYRGKLYNCGVVIQNGQILGIVPKINIPNYNEFYEVRHFTSGIDIGCEEIKRMRECVFFGCFKNNIQQTTLDQDLVRLLESSSSVEI